MGHAVGKWGGSGLCENLVGGVQPSGESWLGGAVVRHCATFGVHRQDNGSIF